MTPTIFLQYILADRLFKNLVNDSKLKKKIAT